MDIMLSQQADVPLINEGKTMLKKTKRRLYNEGLYSCHLPVGDTSKWTVDQWCDWIDIHGRWWG